MSSIGIAGPLSHLGPTLEHHVAVWRGEFCAVCDGALIASAEHRRGYRLCQACWPDPSTPWTALHASLQWSREDGWCMCLCYPTPEQTGPPVACWLLLHDRADCLAILRRYLCRQVDLQLLQEQSDHAGHATVGFFVGPRRLRALAEATRRDPRTGYEKRKALVLR